MKRQSNLKINYFMNCLLTLSSFLFPLISFRYASRILLPEGTGKVSLAVAVISYFAMFAQLGIPTYGIRACAAVRDDRQKLSRTAKELLIWNLFLSMIAYAALFAAIAVIPKLREERALYLICSVSILMNALGMEWLYKALELYTFITVRSILTKALSVVAIFLLIHKQSDYVLYGAIFTGAGCVNYLFNLLRVHRYVDLYVCSNEDSEGEACNCRLDLHRHLRPMLVFFAMSCAVTIYTNLDLVMLGFMTSDWEVGNYHASVMVKNILVAAVTSLAAVLLPRASYYVENGQMEEYRTISRKALNFAVLSSMPLSLFFVMSADKCISFLAGDAYNGAVVPLRILMPAIVFIAVSNITGIQMLVPLGKEKVVLVSELAGMAVDIVLNSVLIPKYGASGAAIGTMVAELVVLTVQCWHFGRDLSWYFSETSWGRILLGCGIGYAASRWIYSLSLGAFVTIIIGGCLFFGTFLAAMFITKENMTMYIYNVLMSRMCSMLRRR